MKKNILLAAGLLILVLTGCGSSQINSVTNDLERYQDDTTEESGQLLQQDADAGQSEEEAQTDEDSQEEEVVYVEGMIPDGRYYLNGDTSESYWTFFITDNGGGYYEIDNKALDGTYEYDPETGTYYFDYDYHAAGMPHCLYEGYFREEDFCLVFVREGRVVDGENTYIDVDWEYYMVTE